MYIVCIVCEMGFDVDIFYSCASEARNNLHWDGAAPVPLAPPNAWLLPCSDKLALRIAKLRERLLKAGWKIISSSVNVIESLGNKANLPGYARKLHMTDFLPCHFTPESAVYPCVLKPSKGEYGKDSYVCKSREEVQLFEASKVSKVFI